MTASDSAPARHRLRRVGLRRLGAPARPADRARQSSNRRWGACSGWTRHRCSRSRGVPTRVCTRAVRWRTSCCPSPRTRRSPGHCRAGWPACCRPTYASGTSAQAPEGFDARFSALSRRYVYRVCDNAVGVDPMRRHEVLWHPRPLDLDRMNAAAALLLGENDFAAYCRRREGATTIRRLLRCDWDRDRPRAWPSARSRPTRSATRWCGRSSARCSRSATAVARSSGPRRCWPPACATRRSRCCRRTGCRWRRSPIRSARSWPHRAQETRRVRVLGGATPEERHAS